jgi:hypothetical protein
MVIGSAAVGALITAMAGSDPGLVLGVFLVAGTVAAGLAVQPRAVYRIIPVPALSYLGAAVLAGIVHDRANGTSGTALAVGATQWIASGFVAMSAATILAIAMAIVRWSTKGRGPRRPGDRPPGPGTDGSRRRRAGGSPPAPRGRQRDPEFFAPAAVRPQRDGIRGA